jgi:hypothetical protein
MFKHYSKKSIIAFLCLLLCFSNVEVEAVQSPETPRVLPGIELDDIPKLPPKPQNTSDSAQDLEPFSFFGNPKDEAGIEQGLRTYITSILTDLEISSIDDLRLDYLKIVPGESGLADMAYAHFVQVSGGMDVDQSGLTFAIKLFPEESRVTNIQSRIFPDAARVAEPEIDPEWAEEKIRARLGKQADNYKIIPSGKKIRWIENQWKAVLEFNVEELGLHGAVDALGKTTLWDARVYAHIYSGNVSGRGVRFNPGATGNNLDQLSLQDLGILGGLRPPDYTNANGNYAAEVNTPQDFLYFRIQGRYSFVANYTGASLSMVKSGENPMSVIFNGSGNQESLTSQINAYYHVTLAHNWAVDKGVAPPGINISISSFVNYPDVCNAFYVPEIRYFTFFNSGSGCRNTAYDTVVYHEYGHFIDDVIGGMSREDGLGEGWGDVMASYISKQPLIGESFYLNGTNLRTADNNYVYRLGDEVHANGQAWAGFAWHLRQNLINSLGNAAGVALAENLVLPVFWANSQNIHEAVYEVYLRDDNDGNLDNGTPHFNEITAAANRHGLSNASVNYVDAKITAPTTLARIGNVNITGTAKTTNSLSFSNYKLEWGLGESPSSFVSSGIVLSNGGGQPVDNGVLGAWNTSGLAADQIYTLRLKVTDQNGMVKQVFTTVKMDPDIVDGWPKQFNVNANQPAYQSGVSPVFADLDDNGIKEIVLGAPDGKLYAFNKGGSNFGNFPVSADSGYIFVSPVNIEDLDGDGKKEIIAIAQNTGGAEKDFLNSKIYIFKSNGVQYPGWPKPVLSISSVEHLQTPNVYDLNEDGQKELIVLERDIKPNRYDAKLHAFRLDGKELDGFPTGITLPNQEHAVQWVSAVDLDRDHLPEIAFGFGNYFYLFNNQGQVLPGWPQIVPRFSIRNPSIKTDFYTPPAFGDLNGDGKLEIVSIAAEWIYAFRKDGTKLSGWPKDTGADPGSPYRFTSPSIADLDRNGLEDVLVSKDKLTIIDSLPGERYVQRSLADNSEIIGFQDSPALADVNGDGLLDVLTYNNPRNAIRVYRADNGALLWQRTFGASGTKGGRFFEHPMVLADLDNNGSKEIAAIRTDITDVLKNSLYLWEVPGGTPNSDSQVWPMYMHDPERTGNSAGPKRPDTIPPAVVITAPIDRSTVHGVVDILSEATDEGGVVLISLQLDGVNLADNRAICVPDSPEPCSMPKLSLAYKWDTGKVSVGSHVLEVAAYDTSKNFFSKTITVNVGLPDIIDSNR